MSALDWITDLENLKMLLEVVGATVALASVVTAMTKTPKDDAVVAKIRGWLDRLSVLSYKDAENTVKLIGTKSKPKE